MGGSVEYSSSVQYAVICRSMFFILSLKGQVSLYTSCVLGLRPSALFNDILTYLSKKKYIAKMLQKYFLIKK